MLMTSLKWAMTPPIFKRLRDIHYSLSIKMSFILSKFLLRIFITECPKSSLFHVTYSAPSARGEYSTLLVFSFWLLLVYFANTSYKIAVRVQSQVLQWYLVAVKVPEWMYHLHILAHLWSSKCNILVTSERVPEKPSMTKISANGVRVRKWCRKRKWCSTCGEGDAEWTYEYIPWRG